MTEDNLKNNLVQTDVQRSRNARKTWHEWPRTGVYGFASQSFHVAFAAGLWEALRGGDTKKTGDTEFRCCEAGGGQELGKGCFAPMIGAYNGLPFIPIHRTEHSWSL